MSAFLIVAILILAFIQPTKEKFEAAIVFAIANLFHATSMWHVSGPIYYGSAAVTDLCVICALYIKQKKCALGIKIQGICLASILVNYVGYSLWHFYQEPTVYDVTFVILYAYSCFLFLDHGLRPTHMGSNNGGLFSHLRSRSHGLYKLKGRV